MARVAVLEKALLDPDCPPGYVADGLANPNNPSSVACYLGTKQLPLDRVVKAGRGCYRLLD